ncbi:MAG: hypothetical protein ABI977_36145 [Acidobacteriota bacterium]
MATTATPKAANTRKGATVGTDDQPAADKYAADTERIAGAFGADAPVHKAAYDEFCRLLNRATPKGQIAREDRVRQLYPIIKSINEEIDEQERDNAMMEKYYNACEKLAAAFETLQRYREFIPPGCFNSDALAKWLNGYQWSDDPALIEEIGSRAIGRVIEDQWFDKVQAKEVR